MGENLSLITFSLLVKSLRDKVKREYSTARLYAAELGAAIFWDDPWWAVNFGLILHRAGLRHEAERVLHKSYGEYIQEPWTIEMALGQICSHFHRFEEAERWYRKALATRPDLTAPAIYLGAFLARQERFPEAIETFEHATLLQGDVDEAYLNIALILRAMGLFRHAKECCEKALAISPHYPEAAANLEDINHAIKVDEELGPLLQQSIESGIILQTEGDRARRLRQQFHQEFVAVLASGHRAAILRATQLAVALFPDYAVWKLEYGQALRLVGQSSRAEQVLLANYDGKYDPWRFEVNLGRLCRNNARYVEAEAWHKKAIINRPDHCDVYIWLAEIFSDQERYAEAIDTLERATMLQGDVDEVFFSLAVNRRILGDYDGAQACFKKAIELSPGKKTATDALKDIEDAIRFRREIRHVFTEMERRSVK